jgi:uncharacterized protein (DUF1330 family)
MISKEVNISKNSVIEIAFSSLIPGKENKFYNEYFPKVFPIVSEYNGKLLFASRVVNYYESEIKSQTIAFFDWPNVETFRKILNDERMSELLKIRNDSLDFISEGNFYKCLHDYIISFDSNKIYSLLSIKTNPYFMDRIKNNNGNIILTLDLVNESIGNLKKDKLAIVEWGDAQSIDSFYYNVIKHNNDNYFMVSFLMN